MRRNASRHNFGAANGNNPSRISSMARATQSESTSVDHDHDDTRQRAVAAKPCGPARADAYFAGARGAAPRPEPDWRK